MDQDKKQKAIEVAIEQIKKQTKDPEAVIRLGDEGKKKYSKGSISTGSISLDSAIGIGGVPRGKIIEVYGPESSGKTTLALHITAQAQKQGGYAAFIDAEHALDPNYAKNLGVNIDNLLLSQPDSGEQALEIVESWVRSMALDIIVIDSVAALTPKAELEGNMGDSHMGLQARLMSQALRKLTALVSKTDTTILFINQLRQKIGVMFGSPETTTGGNALKFYSSLRLDIRRIGQIKDMDMVIGNRTRVKIVKNKVAPPFKMTEFDIMYGKGISYEGDLIDLAIKGGIVVKTGSWFSFEENQIGQGREKVKIALQEDKKLKNKIEKQVKAYLGM
tara:strand:- start:804 stop:1802 length:999 start_codon:yes stop_codon:yes gene_type:complete